MKENIKKSAINLFYKKGYFATSVQDIARATGIRKASIYYHYANKEEILVDILNSTMADLQARLDKVLATVSDPEERMRGVVYSHIVFHIERQKEAIIADSELRGLTAGNFKEVIQKRDVYEKAFQAVMADAIDAGRFAVADPKVVSYGIITMCTAVCTWFKRSGRLSKNELAQVYTDFIFKGLTQGA